MMLISDIARLARLIVDNTTLLDNHLQAHNIPQPSFHEDGPVGFGSLGEHPEVEEARKKALEACLELSDLLQGPLALLLPTVYICLPLHNIRAKGQT